MGTKHPRWRDRIGIEQTGVLREGAGLKPDIVIRHPGGLPVVIETEYSPARTVESDARARLGKMLQGDGRPIEQSIALRIPNNLAAGNQQDLEQSINDASLEFCVFSGNPKHPARWPEHGWIQGGIDDLAACIELAALSEDRIAEGLEILELKISQAANLLRDHCAERPAQLELIASKLHQEDGIQTTRMAMAIIANALIFQTAIAGTGNKDRSFVIKILDDLRGKTGRIPKINVMRHWYSILDEINYWPIFKIASNLLASVPDRVAQMILERMLELSSELAELGTTSQHDLSGRMFQRLISDRKFLATFYTLPSSAALLAELAVARLDTDWSDKEAVKALRIADFACGTGALLNAAYQVVLSRYRRHSGDDRELHAAMMEATLVGSDIMPAATHLTASVLSSVHPEVPFASTSIITLPYGEQPAHTGQPTALGALDLIGEETTIPLFGTGQERLSGSASGNDRRIDIPHGGFDLVIMNPPFTRPTNHEVANVPVPSFAGFATQEDEQRAMSRKLQRIRKPGMAGHGNAGLASNFMDIAHAKLKSDGGVLALVLPASFLQGASWAGARRMLEEHYRDVAIISIAATGSTNCAFSADTGMAEVLIVASRKDDDDKDKNEPGDRNVMFVNLFHRPRSILEAVTTAWTVGRLSSAGERFGPVSVGTGHRLGHYIRGTFAEMGSAGVRSLETTEAAAGLTQGELWLSRRAEPLFIPVCRLGDLGRRGLLHRDINGTTAGIARGPFDIVALRPGSVPTYPALWWHEAQRETRLVVAPDSMAEVRPGSRQQAVAAWRNTSSRLHFTLDFRINSQPLAACMTSEPSIGGRAWANFLCQEEPWEIPLVLWANTTLGLMAFWWIGTRQHQGRARLTISRLPALPVLDTRRLSDGQLERARTIFDAFRNRELLPANEAWRDDVRQALDRAVLMDLLGLPEDMMESLDLLRLQWCAEPSVHGGKETAPV
ncbi:hypothetical protein [Candidatus Synechococcus spongiarum]|uniref:hypothetical protein n=1 Tax=Candidatus Synechococcus spongiarum TaxID=431041 RepID=UPI00126842D6|nr:hypothetical protein [Candidatus Synechococcus spongiarum]